MRRGVEAVTLGVEISTGSSKHSLTVMLGNF
jgi:hypothetical protein